MIRNRKLITVILCLVMCVALLAACGEKDTTATTTTDTTTTTTDTTSPEPATTPPASGDDMQHQIDESDGDVTYADHIEVIIDNNRISVVNPLEPASNATSTYWVMTMIYDKLISYDDVTGNFEPVLATKWTSTDSQTYVFDLRDDVTFHNGEKFTANDVVYTIEKSREVPGTMMASQWAPVATATALSDYQLELVLDGVNVDFLMNTAQPTAMILNQKAIDSDPENGPYVGTGAFTYVDFSSNEYVTVERNDNYWGVAPLTKSMTLRFIPEVTARATMIQNNESQISFGTGVEDYDLFRNENYSIFPLTMNNCQGFTFNMNNPITADKNFRLACAYAMDFSEIAYLSSGEWGADITDGAFWGFATEFRNTDIPAIKQDIELAKQYLADSIYKGEVIELSASISTNVKSCEVVQLQLADIGIETKVNATDSAGLNAMFFDNNHQIMFHGMPFTYAAGSAKHLLAPGGAQNRGSYNNPEVSDLLVEAAATTDSAARSELYKQIQTLVAEDAAFFCVYWRLNGIVGVKGIGGLKLPSDTVQTDLRGAYWIID